MVCIRSLWAAAALWLLVVACFWIESRDFSLEAGYLHFMDGMYSFHLVVDLCSCYVDASCRTGWWCEGHLCGMCGCQVTRVVLCAGVSHTHAHTFLVCIMHRVCTFPACRFALAHRDYTSTSSAQISSNRRASS